MSDVQPPTPRLQPLNEDRDAARWAREFNESLKRFYPGNCQPPLDEGWLIGWFANAMMCGEDTYRWRKEAEARTAASETAAPKYECWPHKHHEYDGAFKCSCGRTWGAISEPTGMCEGCAADKNAAPQPNKGSSAGSPVPCAAGAAPCIDDKPSDTPRTDAKTIGTWIGERVEADFARQLERELAEANGRADRWQRRLYEQHGSTPTSASKAIPAWPESRCPNCGLEHPWFILHRTDSAGRS